MGMNYILIYRAGWNIKGVVSINRSSFNIAKIILKVKYSKKGTPPKCPNSKGKPYIIWSNTIFFPFFSFFFSSLLTSFATAIHSTPANPVWKFYGVNQETRTYLKMLSGWRYKKHNPIQRRPRGEQQRYPGCHKNLFLRWNSLWRQAP